MGIFLAIITAVFASSKDLVSKQLASSLQGATSAFASFAYALPIYIVVLLAGYLSGFVSLALGSSFLLFVLARALSDTGAEWTKMHALRFGDISLLGPYMSLSTVFLVILSPIITGDPITPRLIASVILVVLGCIVITGKPSKRTKSDLKGILFALLSAFCFAINNCFDRLAVQQADPVIAGFAMTLLSALFLLPFALRQRDSVLMMKAENKTLLLRAVFEVLFMIAKLSALQYLSAVHLSCLTKLSVLFTVFGGKVVFKEGEFAGRLVGALLVVAGAVLSLF